MSQCFFSSGFDEVFAPGGEPEIVYICFVEGETAQLPRTMHQHEELAELTLVCDGSAVRRIGGRTYRVKKGDLIFYNSGELHDEVGGKEAMQQFYCVGIRGLQFKGMARHHLLPPSLCPVIPGGRYVEPLRQLFAQIDAQAKLASPGASTVAVYLLRALLAQVRCLVREWEMPLASEDCALGERVRVYLNAHYREAVSLAQVAAAVNANPYYLSHVFKSLSGYAPLQYVTRRRIGEAQNLLINTEGAIADIAAQVGYENSNHFQNVFRAVVGMPPGRYRKEWRKKPPQLQRE